MIGNNDWRRFIVQASGVIRPVDRRHGMAVPMPAAAPDGETMLIFIFRRRDRSAGRFGPRVRANFGQKYAVGVDVEKTTTGARVGHSSPEAGSFSLPESLPEMSPFRNICR